MKDDRSADAIWRAACALWFIAGFGVGSLVCTLGFSLAVGP